MFPTLKNVEGKRIKVFSKALNLSGEPEVCINKNALK